MFGGADPLIADLVPSDIEIVGNHFAKPLRWKADDPRYEGVAWSVKNLFELKNARRVLVEGNLFEYNWPHAQNGFAILFTVRNQDGARAVVGGRRRHVPRQRGASRRPAASTSSATTTIIRAVSTSRIAIVDNVFADVGGSWGHGRLFQVLDGTRRRRDRPQHRVPDRHAAVRRRRTARIPASSSSNNIVLAGTASISGSGTKAGLATLDRYFPGSHHSPQHLHRRRSPSSFLRTISFPAKIDDVGRAPAAHGEAFAKLAARYAAAGTDGRDPGAAAASAALTHARTARASRAAVVAGNCRRDRLSRMPRRCCSGSRSSSSATSAWATRSWPAFAPQSIRGRGVARRSSRASRSIVAAHNEADRIERRLRNLLALDYPADRLEVVLGSDGSTDDTVARARPFESAGVIVHEFAERRGKPALLNALVPRASGEIVVFADARQRFDPLARAGAGGELRRSGGRRREWRADHERHGRGRARRRRRGAVLALRKTDSVDGKPRRIHGRRDRRDLCDPQGAVRAAA